MSATLNIDALWAKSKREPMIGFMPIRAHLIDVGVAAEEIYRRQSDVRRSTLQSTFGANDEETAKFVGYIASLHDIGKATPTFQAKWNEGYQGVKRAGYSFPSYLLPKKNSEIRHEVFTYAIVKHVIQSEGTWSLDLETIIDCLVVHHGRYPSNITLLQADQALQLLRSTCSEWTTSHELLHQELLRVFSPAVDVRPQKSTSIAVTTLAGIVSAADWIGSSLAYDGHIDTSTKWYEKRRENVQQLLHALHWKNTPFVAISGYDDCFVSQTHQSTFTPRPLQSVLADRVENVNTPSLIVVEAPMGEGKTEAALFAAARLMNKLGHEGVYVALPTMATANQMYGRVRSFIENTIGKHNKALLQLLHGGTILNDSYTEILARGNTTESDDVSDAVSASSWFTGSKQGFLTQYAVGTVDQALHGVLYVKHWFMRLYGLSNKVVILDEVHAYDAYTSRLIVELVQWLAQLRCSVILMSATLPTALKKNLEEAYAQSADASMEGSAATSYPRITIRSDQSHSSISFPTSSSKDVILQHVSSDLHAVASLLLDEARKGNCVAAIMNTVKRAQQLYTILRDQPDVEMLLFHARMPGIWRADRESKVIQLYGADGSRPSASILVATQVVEQSLDVDFDIMYTDLAPVDLILQRSGRLHRHGWRSRNSAAILFIGGTSEVTDVRVRRTFGVGTVYDAFPVLQTASIIQSRSTLVLPDDIDGLVQDVYGSENLVSDSITQEMLEEARLAYLNRVETKIREVYRVRIGSPHEERPLQVDQSTTLKESELSAMNQTRLSGASITIAPIIVDNGKRITLSGYEYIPGTKESALEVRKSSFSVSDHSIIAEVLSLNRLCSDSPYLYDHHVLDFTNYRCVVGKHTIVLDRELGVIYESEENNKQERNVHE